MHISSFILDVKSTYGIIQHVPLNYSNTKILIPDVLYIKLTFGLLVLL